MKSLLTFVLVLATSSIAQELKLNPHLDYNSDSQDGPLITGKEAAAAGLAKGKVNYIFIFEEG
ncbi:MAG: hypothetical protein DMG67_03570 [Acidobacteria bacterium]|nr:MAG: hypothetical protein DMG67_03570 [Acidobacteriota bacterium]